MKPLVKQMLHNETENKQLANLRDTLLPKLMNGEIDVDKIKI
jgi:type I restriction enzyme S subunit